MINHREPGEFGEGATMCNTHPFHGLPVRHRPTGVKGKVTGSNAAGKLTIQWDDGPISKALVHDADEFELQQSLEERWPIGKPFRIEHDGFLGVVIGYYQRRDGKRGVVGQHMGNNIVHVYGEKWLKP